MHSFTYDVSLGWVVRSCKTLNSHPLDGQLGVVVLTRIIFTRVDVATQPEVCHLHDHLLVDPEHKMSPNKLCTSHTRGGALAREITVCSMKKNHSFAILEWNIGRQKVEQNKHGSREWLSTLQDFVPFPNSHAVPCGQISMHELVFSEIFHSFSNFDANLQQGAHSQLEKQKQNKTKTMRNPEVSSLSINNMWTCDVDWKLWLESFESGEKQEEFDEQVALKVCCWLINSVLPTKNLSCQPSDFLSSREQQKLQSGAKQLPTCPLQAIDENKWFISWYPRFIATICPVLLEIHDPMNRVTLTLTASVKHVDIHVKMKARTQPCVGWGSEFTYVYERAEVKN